MTDHAVNEWTRKDLPDLDEMVNAYLGNESGVIGGVITVLDAVVAHLNANGGLPAADDRWRRAHSIVEQERDQARRERDEAIGYRRAAETERDDANAACRLWLERAATNAEKFSDMERERDEWKARAEAAEARPAVTLEEVAEAISRAWGEDGSVSPHGVLDRLWPLVSGADPAVLVVRESDVAAVEVTRDSDGWYADGAWVASADGTAEWVRDRAAEMVVCAARNEAVARAIEAGQAVDPVEAKARELAKAGGVDFDEQEPEGVEMLIGMARHVLGQGAGDE